MFNRPSSAEAMTPSARVAVAAPSGGLELTKQIVGRVLLGGGLFFSAVAYEAEPVLIGALIVLGSSIPIWIKARRAEKLATGGGGIGRTKGRDVERELERRMADLEDRQQLQMAESEDRHQRQLTDLEERVDFAERLLTKQREKMGP